MPPAPRRLLVERNASALRSNFRILRDLSGGLELLPMLKANAYGHGDVWAARALVRERGLRGFGVATLEEGKRLREALEEQRSGFEIPILIFSGLAPFTEEYARICEKQGLTPVIASLEDWRKFLSSGWARRLPYHLKFNTGMNRLGIPISEARRVARSATRGRAPEGVCTHLAMSESPFAPLSKRQLSGFIEAFRPFEALFPGVEGHFANSGAIWRAREWKTTTLTDFARPGLSLYGVPPWENAPPRGVQTVLRASAAVISIREIAKGEPVGYDGTWKAPRRSQIAVLAAGYADGVPRRLGNRGKAWLRGRSVPIVGVVSMDMIAVLAPAGTKIGDQAELFGPKIDPWKQARAAGTVPYEHLTSTRATLVQP